MSCNCEKEKSNSHSLIVAGKSIIKNFTDPTYDAFVSSKVLKERLKHCESCELLTTFVGMKQCSACGCFVEAKAKLKSMRCEHPENPKWIEE
jgi:hypothetical protein